MAGGEGERDTGVNPCQLERTVGGRDRWAELGRKKKNGLKRGKNIKNCAGTDKETDWLGGSKRKAVKEGKTGRFGRVVVWESMDCLWERDVCQAGTTLIGKWITTEVEINSLCVCLYGPV